MIKFLKNLMTSVSGTDIADTHEYDLIGNCFGFFSLQGGVGTSTFCYELGQLIAEKGINVCIVDCNPLSTFYVTKNMSLLEKNKIEDIPGISNRLKKRSSEVRESLIEVNSNLFIASFGSTQYIDTFSIDATIISSMFEDLKNTFDLVIMDIPGLPWLETVIPSLQICSTVYTLCNFSADTISRYIKFDNLFDNVGLQGILNNLIVTRCPPNTSIAKNIESSIPARVLAEIPSVPGIIAASLKETSILLDIRGKEAKQYEEVLRFICKEMLEGISDKRIASEE